MVETHISKDSIALQRSANEGRDFGIYKGAMDAALEAKANSILPHFGNLPETGAIIVDAGSGTGQLAELIARKFHGIRIYALDISHELMEAASDNQALATLVYGDASLQNFPEESVDVKYYSTSGHEIESFGGKDRMVMAVKSTLAELKAGGRIIIRDFAKPEIKDPVYMQIQTQGGLDDVVEVSKNGYIDYNLLSTKALFLRFHQEFSGGDAFKFEIINIDGQEYIKLDACWAHEFYLRKDYTANWRQEIQEKYTYWTPQQAKNILEEAGYTGVQVVPDPNEYILTNRLNGKIGLFILDDHGKLRDIPFPPTHMVVTGEKPKIAETKEITEPSDTFEKAVDYKKLQQTISFDEKSQTITIGEQNFLIDDFYKPIKGSKKVVYHLLGEPPRVLKVVRVDEPNAHGIFKAMYQSVARENLLDEYEIPHLRVLEVDSQGPPYRYFIQEAVPANSISAASLIASGKLTEEDVSQMASYINVFELSKKWQLDTNPFNWYRVPQKDGTNKMMYVDGKVYLYDEKWEFRRVGLLQWLDQKYVDGHVTHSAIIPKVKEYDKLQKEWNNIRTKEIAWWKKYLNPLIQPL